VKENAANTRWLKKLAQAYEGAGKDRAALRIYQELVARDRQNLAAWRKVARLAEALNQIEDSLKSLRQCEAHPERHEARRVLGRRSGVPQAEERVRAAPEPEPVTMHHREWPTARWLLPAHPIPSSCGALASPSRSPCPSWPPRPGPRRRR